MAKKVKKYRNRALAEVNLVAFGGRIHPKHLNAINKEEGKSFSDKLRTALTRLYGVEK